MSSYNSNITNARASSSVDDDDAVIRSRSRQQEETTSSPSRGGGGGSSSRRHASSSSPSSAGQNALRQLTSNRAAATVVRSSPPSAATTAAAAASTIGGLTDRLESTSLNNNNSNNGNSSRAFELIRPRSLQQQHLQQSAATPRNSSTASTSSSSPWNENHQYQRHQQQQQQHSTFNNSTSSSIPSNNNKEGWTTVETLSYGSPPCQRSLHAAAIVHDSLYVFGGYDGQHRVNDFYQYNFTTKCWREIVTLNSHLVGGTHLNQNNLQQQQQMQHNNNNNNNNLHQQNGGGNVGRQDPPAAQQQYQYHHQQHQQHQQHRFQQNQPPQPQQQQQPNSNTVTATGTVPTPRDRHAAVVHGSTFYIFGGFDGTSRVSDLYGFDVLRLTWRLIVPRVGVVTTNTNNNNNAIGGGGGGGGNNHGGNNGIVDNNNQNNNNPAMAAFHNINVDAGGGGIGGGRGMQQLHVQQPQQQNNNMNFEADGQPQQPQQQQQQQQQQQRAMVRQHHDPPSPRHSHAAVVYQDSMYVFGGYDGSYRSDFHEFNFLESSWRPVFGSGRSPRARYRSTACVHEDTMILFGGHDGTRHLADVHTFDFVNNVWGLLVIDGVAPLPRDSHVSVVYKDSVFVFGGSTGSAMNDLHELQLPSSSSSNNNNNDQSSSNAVLADLSAGDHGIIGNGPEDGGGPSSLLPRTAKWRQIPQMSGEGIAVHRFCHVGAVYNGSFYVFGGYDGSHRLNDFVKYDLAADDLLETDIPPPSLLADLRSFLDDEDAMSLSDITLMVEGIPVRAHKLMLMRCPYFKAMLLGNMSESKQSVVHLEIVRHRIILAVLEYLYTDDVEIPLELAMELFVAADLFAIPRLQSMCERRLLESMTVENAASIFHTADVHSAVSLRAKALGYVLSHFEAVSKTDAFEDMARSNVELVFEILRSR